MNFILSTGVLFILLIGCSQNRSKTPAPSVLISDSVDIPEPTAVPLPFERSIETGETSREELVNFATTLIGTPYLYASTDPAKGFDCSGFINYVFNHFGIAVPRSSVDFTNLGIPVDPSRALPGDLVLFTGTDSTVRVVGHMGIVVRNENGKLEFIHSSSGKANGVVISPLENYYRSRFVKLIRVFKD